MPIDITERMTGASSTLPITERADTGYTPVIGISGDELPEVQSFRPIMSDRELRRYGTISPETDTFFDKAKRFAWEIVPFHQYMTEEGRKLFGGLPAEARADRNFGEFAQFLEFMIGGENAIAGFGKKAIERVSKESLKLGGSKILKNLEDAIDFGVLDPIKTATNKNQKFINEMYDGILLHPSEVTTPALRQKVINALFDEDEIKLPLTKKQPEKQTIGMPLITPSKIKAKSEIPEPLKTQRQPAEEALPEKEVPLRPDQRNVLEKLYQKTETPPSPLLKPKKEFVKSPKPKTVKELLEDEKGMVDFTEGFKIFRESVENATKRSQEIYKNLWFKPVSQKDVKWWQQATSLPHWMAKKYPQIKEIYGIQMARQDARFDMLYGMMEKVDPFLKLKGDDYAAVKKILLLGDREGRTFTTEELARSGASKNVIDGYRAVRSTLDSVLEDYFSRMKQWGIPEDEILKYRQQIGKTGGYFPRIRQGKYFIRAQKKGEPSRRVHFNNPVKGGRVRKELLDEGYEIIESGKVTSLPEEIYFQISPEAISQVVDVASKNFDDTIKQQLRRNVADVFKERGWMRHGLARKDYIAGFETDNLKDVLYNYLSGYSGFVTKAEAAKEFRKRLVGMAFDKTEKGIAARETPGLYEWSTKYVRDVMENSDAIDDIGGKIRSAFFYKYLGGVVKSGFVNLTQNYIAAAPRLSLDTKFAYGKITKAMVDIVEYYSPKVRKTISEEETKALRIALNRGWTKEQYMTELMGHVSKYGSVPRKIQKILGGPMAIAERFNRQSTFLAAFRVFKKEKGLPFDKAVEAASEVVLDSHFVYGKSNLPGAFRGGKVQKIAHPAYTFRTFTHNYLNLLGHMYRKSPAAVAKSMASIGALGGVSSLPLFKTAESVAQRYGYQPRSYIKEKLNEYGFGDKTQMTVLYGIPAVMDIDLGGSIGIEMPGQRTFSADDPKAVVMEGAVDILGVPGSIVEDTIKSTQQLHTGDVYRAIEDSPVTPILVSNAMRAKRLATEGQLTRSGKQVLDENLEPIKLSKREAIQKGVFGFQTVGASEGYRKYVARKAERKRWERKRNNALSEYAKMGRRYGLDSKQAEAALKKIEKINANRPEFASEITDDVIERRLLPSGTRKKGFDYDIDESEQILRRMIR